MTNKNILHLPKDFSGASDMFNIQIIDALQFFVRYMTVYFYLAKIHDKTIYLASMVLDTFYDTRKKMSRMDEYKRIVGIKYIKQVMQIIMNEEGKNKERKYNALIKRWYNEIKAKLPSYAIDISGGQVFALPNDFCILCDILRCSPVEVLQYYVDHVSLEKYANSTEENAFVYATEFFLQYPPISKLIDAS